jgi:hypothetical protein
VTTLSYPHVLTAGQPENVNDLNDNLNAITTWSAGNIDTTNLAATAKPATLMGRYGIVAQGALLFDSTMTAGTYYPAAEGGTISPAPKIGVSISGTPVVIPVKVADYAVSGLTTQFRVQALTLTNPTAPAINLTFGVAQILTLGGGVNTISIATVGSVLGGVTLTTPGASAGYVTTGSDFTISSGDLYVLVVTTSGTPAANARVAVNMTLQVHNI